MSLENLQTLYGVDDSKQKYFDKIERSINRIDHQMTDVLDFVRRKPVNLSKVMMSEIITEITDSIEIPTNIKFIFPKNDVELFCDRKPFSIAMINLILNAIQAADNKCTIEITCYSSDDAIIIKVKDSGKGIPKDIINNIFEPLFTTKQQGTGLGLASVKSIIDAHHGTISVTSPPTVFTIMLPKINS